MLGVIPTKLVETDVIVCVHACVFVFHQKSLARQQEDAMLPKVCANVCVSDRHLGTCCARSGRYVCFFPPQEAFHAQGHAGYGRADEVRVFAPLSAH